MTLKQLEAFYWAARLDSFAHAAARLHITQSTLSKRIADLEAALGAGLFNRSGYRTQLTELGRSLVEPCAKVLEQCQQIALAAGDGGRPAGKVAFGVTELVAGLWLAPWVAAMRAEYPEIVLEPVVDTTATLTARLGTGEIDFAVMPMPMPGPAYTSARLADLAFALIAHPDMVPGGTLTAEALATLPVLAQSGGSGLTAMLDAWALSHGLTLRRTLASNSLVAISELVLAGIGAAFLPVHYYAQPLREGRLAMLRGPIPWPSLSYYLVARAGPTEPAALALRGVAQRHCAAWRAAHPKD